MGKRSTFERRKNDAYQTPFAPVPPLIPHLSGVDTFADPCAGEGRLIDHLQSFGLKCVFSDDIENGFDALTNERIHFARFDAIITNPPWTRAILHPMIKRFQSIAPTWLLFDADWVHTKQSTPYLDQCSHIVPVGRVKWIEGSPHTGKDNAAWHRFHVQHTGGPKFYAREMETT